MSNAQSKFASKVATMLAGLKSGLLASVKSIPVAGELLTLNQVQQPLQDFVTADADVVAKRDAYRQAVQARTEKEAQVRVIFKAVVVFVKQLFAKDASTLAKFGVESKAPAKSSVETKAIAKAKRTATLKQKKATQPAPKQEQVVVLGADGQPIGAAPATAPVIPPPSGNGSTAK
jgi:hypothetical protein